MWQIDPADFSMAFAGVVVLALAYLFWQQRRMKKWYRHLCDCDEAGTLAEAVERSSAIGEKTRQRVEMLEKGLDDVVGRLPCSFSRIGLVRYNPFHGMGGDNSFSLVLADESGRGVVITALYARDQSRVYAKPLDGWTSTRQLTEEEREAIEEAKSSGIPG